MKPQVKPELPYVDIAHSESKKIDAYWEYCSKPIEACAEHLFLVFMEKTEPYSFYKTGIF
jgi:hypothetical protein